MNIAALPMPVPTSLVYPKPDQSRVATHAEAGYPSRQRTRREPQEQVLQGEVLDRQKAYDQRKPRDGYTTEGRSYRDGYSPLYGQGPKNPVEQYLATSELDASSLNTRPLLDLYV